MKKVLILSGAGLSAESGLRTFRDSGGLWEQYDVMEVCSVGGFGQNRELVLEFYDKRRAQLEQVAPNDAHHGIAKLKEQFGEQICVITQNVDDLLERAGCTGVVHLHGFLPEVRCEECGELANIGYDKLGGRICGACGSAQMRHNVVMFDEQAPLYATLYETLAENPMLVVIGTSGEVLPVDKFAKMCDFSILNNLEIPRKLGRNFSLCFEEKATTAWSKIKAEIENFLAK